MKQKVRARMEKIERTIRGNDRLGRWKPDKAKANKKRKKNNV
jgi:hypothetical protein